MGLVAVDEVVVPTARVDVERLPSEVLYRLEQAGEIAKEILDERVVRWAEGGMKQAWMADELGCSQQAVSKRLARLGIETRDPRGRPKNNNQVVKPPRQEVLPPDRPAQHLPDLLAPDAPDNLRTQVVRWCELGRHIEMLITERAVLEPKSDEDVALIAAEVSAMARIATQLEKKIRRIT